MNLDVQEWIDADPEPTLLVTIDGTIRAANQAAARLLESSPSGVRGTSLLSAVRQEPAQVTQYLAMCARSRQPLPAAFHLLRSTGGESEFRCDGRVLRPRAGDEPAVVQLNLRKKDEGSQQFLVLNEKIHALSREISVRRKTELERDQLLASERAARNEAERVSRLKDEFLATLSHELRTPLNAILGWTQILKMGRLDANEMKEGLDLIERNTRVQTQVIEDLLDVSRIISGKVRLDVQRVDVANVLEAAIQSVRPSLEAKGIRLQQVLDSLNGVVMGDPGRLQQIFWNLLSNSAKFTPKGGRIQVLLERVNSHVEVSVIDTGMGIAPAFLPHVFERFRQADSSSTRHYGGLGLGLAITRHLVELHGGSIRAKSKGEGQGATFVVNLPITVLQDRPAESNRSASSTHSDPGDCPPQLQGLTVLAVDDEPDSLAMLTRVLEMCGCNVLKASNAAEAFEILKKKRPAVLVSDIGMPGEDGYDLVRRVRALPPEEGGQTPAIALTAFARSEDRRRVLMAGFQMHLSKPAESAELIAVVASVAGRTAPPSGGS